MKFEQYLNRQVWAYTVDADQGRTCLPLRLHLLDMLLYRKSTLLKF